MLKTKCLVHKSCKASVKVNGVDVCFECWNSGSAYGKPERAWIEKATKMYARGLITEKELNDKLAIIAYHLIDETIPVFI